MGWPGTLLPWPPQCWGYTVHLRARLLYIGSGDWTRVLMLAQEEFTDSSLPRPTFSFFFWELNCSIYPKGPGMRCSGPRNKTTQKPLFNVDYRLWTQSLSDDPVRWGRAKRNRTNSLHEVRKQSIHFFVLRFWDFSVCMCTCMGMHALAHRWRSRTPAGVSFLLPSCRCWGLNSGHQAQSQAPLPAKHLVTSTPPPFGTGSGCFPGFLEQQLHPIPPGFHTDFN